MTTIDFKQLNNRPAALRPHPGWVSRWLMACLLVFFFLSGFRSARADEFTVGHTGADVAVRQFGVTGKNYTIAVIDSGIRISPDLIDLTNWNYRVIANVSFTPDGSADDKCGHGTHVAGIVGGNGLASSGWNCFRKFTGIATEANLVNVRVLDEAGQATVSTVIQGIQWCITNKANYNIRVLNLSLGHPVGESYTTDPLCQAVEAAWKAGIVVVCAAGNDGRLNAANTAGLDNEGWGTAYGSIQSPGNDPYVITVGAMKEDLSTAAPGAYAGNRAYDRISTYSSRGPSRLDFVMKPDLVAPGNRVISLESQFSTLYNANSGTNQIPWSDYSTLALNGSSLLYFRLSGTSMATPVVSGAAALMLQANPSLTPDSVKARLMLSADKWANPDNKTDPCTYGAGYLNIPAALNCAAITRMPALSPKLSRDAAGNVYVDAKQIIWGTDVNGNHVIWGVSGVNNLQVIWGTHVIWGNSANILKASHVIWGNSVWSDLVIWGTNTTAADLSSTAIDGE